MGVNSFRDLRVWQAGMDLVEHAQASLAELQTQLEIAHRLHYVTFEQSKEVLSQSTALAKQLYALRNAIQKGGK